MAWKPDYATLAEARTFLGISDAADTGTDSLISLALTTASRNIDAHCHRQFGLGASTTRYYAARARTMGPGYIADIDDLSSASGLVVTSTPTDGTATTLTDYVLWPRNALANGKPYEAITFDAAPTTDEHGLALASSSFGWAAVPSTVKVAALLQMARLVRRKDAPFGVAGSPELGNELRLLDKLDPDVAQMLRGLVRHWA